MNTVLANRRLLIIFALCCLLGAGMVEVFPGYLTNTNVLGFLIFVEIILAAVWNYRERYFPLLALVFFFAGTGVPPIGFWHGGRWLVLAVGAGVGIFTYPRDCSFHFDRFHLAAFFCVIAAALSAYASSYPKDSLFKVASFFLLCLYSTSGIRTAVAGREKQFFSSLLMFSEVLTYLTAVCYFILDYEFYGNPNSLGAVMGVFVVPMLLWGVFYHEGTTARRRLVIGLVVAVSLLATSYARAGILAAAVSSLLVCLALRRYRALIMLTGTGLLAASMVTFVSPPTIGSHASLASTFIYKGHPEAGVLGSRKSPWEQTISSVREHPWFGTGFGTSTTGSDANDDFNTFRASTRNTREHGSSYLAVLEWVGLLGVWPFALLLVTLDISVATSLVRIRRIGSHLSPMVPVVGVVLAGLVHAAFEDWLFAAGYYLCVLFWALAFVLVDFVRNSQLSPCAPPPWQARPA